MKYLGIDYGLRKIGLAIADGDARVVVPFDVIERTDDVVKRLAELIASEGIDEVVVGMPEREQGKITGRFTEELARALHVPVRTVDESYTSVESQRIQEESGSRVKEDALAAMIILESYFNVMERHQN